MTTIDVAEAAKRLNISEKAVRRSLKRGEIKGIKLAGVWRIDDNAIPDFISEPTADSGIKQPPVLDELAVLKKSNDMLSEKYRAEVLKKGYQSISSYEKDKDTLDKLRAKFEDDVNKANAEIQAAKAEVETEIQAERAKLEKEKEDATKSVVDAQKQLDDIGKKLGERQQAIKKIDDDIAAKIAAANTEIDAKKLEVQGQINESMAEVSNIRKQADAKLIDAESIISYANKTKEWLGESVTYEKTIRTILGQILYALQDTSRYFSVMAIDASSLRPLMMKYVKIMESWNVKPFPIAPECYRRYSTSVNGITYVNGKDYPTYKPTTVKNESI